MMQPEFSDQLEILKKKHKSLFFRLNKYLNYLFAVWSRLELWPSWIRGRRDAVLKAFVKILEHISVGYFEFSPKQCQLTSPPLLKSAMLYNTEHFFRSINISVHELHLNSVPYEELM